MANYNISDQESQFTARATLIGLGTRIERQGIMDIIGKKVKIKQKTVKDSPLDKMTDALATILAGGKGLVEANKRVRADRSVQRAFGRERCAEQSVISETFNACDANNVGQMEAAMREIYQAHSEGYRHDYEQARQVLDIDLTGQPCGKKAAFASKGYFAHQRNRRGRQLGRVWATAYKEVVVDQLYEGQTTLPRVLQELVGQAEAVLELDHYRRERTILRIDAHGGSLDDVNWMLKQGYGLITKEYNAVRAGNLAASVTTRGLGGKLLKNRLKVLRAERGWSQLDLAGRVEVSRQSVNAIETGKYDPSLPLAFRIADVFGLPIEEIFLRD